MSTANSITNLTFALCIRSSTNWVFHAADKVAPVYIITLTRHRSAVETWEQHFFCLTLNRTLLLWPWQFRWFIWLLKLRVKQLVSKSQFIQQIGWILTQGKLQWGHNCFMKTTRARYHQLLLDWTCANLPTFSWGALCENANVWVRTSELLRVSPAGLLEKTPMSQCVIRRIHCERGGVVMTFLTSK